MREEEGRRGCVWKTNEDATSEGKRKEGRKKRTSLSRKRSLLLHVGPELLDEFSDDGSLGFVVVETFEVGEEGRNSSFESGGEVGSDEGSEFGFYRRSKQP